MSHVVQKKLVIVIASPPYWARGYSQESCLPIQTVLMGAKMGTVWTKGEHGKKILFTIIIIYGPLNLQLVLTPMRSWIEKHSYRCFHGCHPPYLVYPCLQNNNGNFAWCKVSCSFMDRLGATKIKTMIILLWMRLDSRADQTIKSQFQELSWCRLCKTALLVLPLSAGILSSTYFRIFEHIFARLWWTYNLVQDFNTIISTTYIL